MAALTANRLVQTAQMDNVQGGIIIDYVILDTEIIFQGALLELLAAGEVQAAGVGATLQGAGLALEFVDNTADGLSVKTLVGGFIVHDVASTTIANIGDPVYASDDQTLTTTAGTNTLIGWIVQFVTGDECIVKMKYPGQPLT